MELDDDLCLCFHVTRRKVVNYIRIRRPQSASQLSECQGAGTGCGWCRPFLRQLWQEGQTGGRADPPLPSLEDYARRRAVYLIAGKGQPPSSDPGGPAQTF
jgi:NAD(P)H-nitrite reductase large subunit